MSRRRGAGSSRPKVLYIAGCGRSGTTILGNILGQAKGFTSVGELHYLWQRGLIENRACGCGERVIDCDTWRGALKIAFGSLEAVDPQAIVASQSLVHTRHARKALKAVKSGKLSERLEYARHLEGIYDGIAASTGARVIVDSSKFPTDAIVAAGLSNIEVYVVHLVRDPRAVAFSWQRRKLVPDKAGNGGLLRRIGTGRSTTVWVWHNSTIAHHVKAAVGSDRYLLVNYEELAKAPERVLEQIEELLDEPDANLRRALDGTAVEMHRSHTASGNPNRFKTGRMSIKFDNEWEHNMPTSQKVVCTILASPMLRPMKYAWRLRRR